MWSISPAQRPAERQRQYQYPACSRMPRAHYDEELAQHQEGVLDIDLQRAGINVLWNDNDGGCKGA